MAHAQAAASPPRVSLTAGLSATSQWDDETHLGSGPLVSIGVSRPFAGRFRWEGELSIARHHRDSGYLKATGTPVVGTARVAYLFLAPERKVRPYVSAGLMVTHSRGHFVSATYVPGPGGLPIPGPEERRDWRLTKGGWETGLGLELRGDGRLWVRPEMRFGFTSGDSGYQPGIDTLETPIMTIRGGIVIGW